MATPATPVTLGVPETLEQYRAKLVKSNQAELERKFRKVFPNLTDEQIAAIPRQNRIEQLVERRKMVMALPGPEVAPVRPGAEISMAQVMEMMMRQQAADRAATLEREKAAAEKEEKRLERERLEKVAAEKAALEREEKRMAFEKAEKAAALEREKAEKDAAIEREERRWKMEKEERDARREEKLAKEAAQAAREADMKNQIAEQTRVTNEQLELERAKVQAQQVQEERRRRDDLAERERREAEMRALIESTRRDADVDRAERLRLSDAQIASQERMERERLANQNSKEVRVKRASDLLHKSIQAMPKFPEDVPAWFSSFETQLSLNGIALDIWLPILNQFLTDKARRLVDRLPAEQIDTYEKLHDAILREYDLTPNAYRKFFDNAQKAEGETWVQLCTRLQLRLKYYVESREVNRDYERLTELLVSDKMKSLIPQSLQDFVRQRELGGWMNPQDLAKNVDTFIADRQIVGPLSLKQFAYVGAAGILSALVYFFAQTWLFVIAALIFFGIAGALAFVKIEGRPFVNILVSAFHFYWRPQTYVWQAEVEKKRSTA